MRKGYQFFLIMVLFGFLLGPCGCRMRSKFRQDAPYVIAYPRDWKSISLYGSEQQVTGFSADLLYAMALGSRVDIHFQTVDLEEIPTLLATNQIDGFLTPLPETVETKLKYAFSKPYFVVGTVVVVAAHSQYTTTDELKNNVEIGFMRGESLDISIGAKVSWLLKPYDSPAAACEDIVMGKLDGVLLNFQQASFLSRGYYRSKIRPLLPAVVKQNIRLVVPKEKNKELIELFNEQLESLIKRGEYAELLRYWDLATPIPVEEEILHSK